MEPVDKEPADLSMMEHAEDLAEFESVARVVPDGPHGSCDEDRGAEFKIGERAHGREAARPLDGDPAAPFEWRDAGGVLAMAREGERRGEQSPPARGGETGGGHDGAAMVGGAMANGKVCSSNRTCREVRTRPEARSKHR